MNTLGHPKRAIIAALTTLGLLLAACTPTTGSDNQPAKPDDTTVSATAAPFDPDAPLSSDDPVPSIPTPTPIAGQVTTGTAFVDSVEILILESFPVQIRALVRGNLADGCTTINQITQQRDGNTFTLTITTVRPTDLMCTQALVPFEESISIDVFGLAAGDYTVDVNGMTAAFNLAVDNIAPDQP